MKNFYEITSNKYDENKGEAWVKINASHPVFKGHFPEQPVVPGVCMLHIIKHCVSLFAGRELRYETIGDCKFTSPVLPGKHSELKLNFEIKLDPVSQSYSVKCVVSAQDVIKLKLKSNLTIK